MFFYRFGYFVSLVTNVTKKSSKSFWDREDLCNQFAQLRSRPEKFSRPFFLHTSRILATALGVHWSFSALHRTSRHFSRLHEASWRHGASQDFTATLELLSVRRASLSPDSSNRPDSSNSFSNSFSNKIFLEQLCFSIDLAVSSLLLLMLLKNPQKVSRIGKTHANSLHS